MYNGWFLQGANDLPNGYVNGINKPPQINGTVPNGNVHITENPQVCNNQTLNKFNENKKKIVSVLRFWMQRKHG